MIKGRVAHGACLINNYLYAVAGYNYDDGDSVKSCERYEIALDRWFAMPEAEFDDFA